METWQISAIFGNQKTADFKIINYWVPKKRQIFSMLLLPHLLYLLTFSAGFIDAYIVAIVEKCAFFTNLW